MLPYIEAETVEVLGDRVGLRVVLVQRPIVGEALQQQDFIGSVVSSSCDGIGSLGVQGSRKALKACREQRDVRVIELLS